MAKLLKLQKVINETPMKAGTSRRCDLGSCSGGTLPQNTSDIVIHLSVSRGISCGLPPVFSRIKVSDKCSM